MSASGLPKVGVIGGGQLARMMHQDAISLDLPVRYLLASEEETMAHISPACEMGSPQNRDDLLRFAASVDVVTFDHELVNLEALEEIQRTTQTVVRPSPNTLRIAADKWHQRTQFQLAGLPVPVFAEVNCVEDVVEFAREHQWPVMLKAARGGYDGHGTWLVTNEQNALEVAHMATQEGIMLFAEEFLPLDEEIAVIVARDANGNKLCYPLLHSVQEQHMCREVFVFENDPASYAQQAFALAGEIADFVELCGVMAIEMFVVGNEIKINEVATRPHNTGHFSIEGAVTSQFENHLRAVAGLPLGSTNLTAKNVVMVNIIGGLHPFSEKEIDHALNIPDVHLHLYGKSWRPRRKLGHVTVCAETLQEARDKAYAAVQILESS